jgi:hypothetical protein
MTLGLIRPNFDGAVRARCLKFEGSDWADVTMTI